MFALHVLQQGALKPSRIPKKLPQILNGIVFRHESVLVLDYLTTQKANELFMAQAILNVINALNRSACVVRRLVDHVNRFHFAHHLSFVLFLSGQVAPLEFQS
jgi:hypothetical protein